jgi:hypothetical protein
MRTRSSHALLVAAILVAGCGDSPTGPRLAATPETALLVTSDIVNFWEAYDAGGKDGSATAFQRDYLDRGSAGLRDFIRLRGLTGSVLASNVRRYPRYFTDVRPNTLRIAEDPALEGRLRAGYRKVLDLYPDAVFPPVFFLIGNFGTGGTVGRSGILVGAEFFALDGNTPTDELGPFKRATVRASDSLPYIVAHEHVHVLQNRRSPLMGKGFWTLLEASLLEGSADFIGELASGGNSNSHIHPYGLANEKALWQEFEAQMMGSDRSDWLGNQGSSTGRPGDLGYFIGYRIAQAYYERAADKRAAVREIIEVGNAVALLQASGYDALMSQP